MRKINMRAAALCAAVPVIAITLFIISRMENNDAPGLYISESVSSSAEGTTGADSRNGREDMPNDENGESMDNDINGGGEDIADSDNAVGGSGEDGDENASGGAANNGTSSRAGGSGSDSSKKSDSSSKAGDMSSSASGKDTNSKASGGSDKDSSESEPEVKYTFDTLDRMVDGNFSISTSGQVNYMVNAVVSGEAEYDGDDTHIKVESAEFPAVNSNVFTQGGETYRVISQDNATYSHNKSIVSAFIDFGKLFESFAANRDYLVPIECSTSGGVTTEKFSYTYYDDLYFYDYVTLLITISYDGSGTPFSLLITTNEDYGYEQLYKSNSLSFSPSIGGVDVPDFDSWTCVDTPS